MRMIYSILNVVSSADPWHLGMRLICSILNVASSAGPRHLGMRLIYSILNVVSCPDSFQKNRGFPEKGSGHETVFYSTQCITTTQYMILILHIASSMEHYAPRVYRINTHTSVLTFHTLCD